VSESLCTCAEAGANARCGGTDATIAQHIQTVVDREYVMERMEGGMKYLVPSTLGMGLIEGYNEIDFDRSLSKPQLRRMVCGSSFEKCDLMVKHVDGDFYG
jgi:DNA topoisomerase-3